MRLGIYPMLHLPGVWDTFVNTPKHRTVGWSRNFVHQSARCESKHQAQARQESALRVLVLGDRSKHIQHKMRVYDQEGTRGS